jgi:hypothetical protein
MTVLFNVGDLRFERVNHAVCDGCHRNARCTVIAFTRVQKECFVQWCADCHLKIGLHFMLGKSTLG